MTTALYWCVPLPALERRCQAERGTGFFRMAK